MENANLKGLKDVNILIGPNNCGKSTILEVINLLRDFTVHSHDYSECSICNSIRSNYPEARAGGVICKFPPDAKYLRRRKVKITFTFNKEPLEADLPSNALKRVRRLFAAHPDHLSAKLVLTEESRGTLHDAHIFPFALGDIQKELVVLKCPDERLSTYKGSDIREYIRDKKPRATTMDALMESMRTIVDSDMVTYNTSTLDFVKKFGSDELDTPIAEQGSGIRSLICLIIDILSSPQANFILIDEPELGLNPAGKNALLQYLMQEADKRQIFIATHDPTFVNPVLWDNDKVALYLFSPTKGTFVNVNLTQNREDPSTFGGFLPHTVSLRKTHVYVEGCLDVYIHQIFLRKFLQSQYEDDWFRKLNKVGIFHLAGSFWEHILYTIPQTPYHSIVLLDGDKRDDAKKIVDKVNSITLLPDKPPRFRFCTKITQLKHRGRPVKPAPILVYYLKKPEIEEYLEPKPPNKNEGPNYAEKMQSVPSEISNIYRSLPP